MSVAHNNIACTEHLMVTRMLWGFLTCEPCAGPTSCYFLTCTAAGLIQATVQESFLM